MSELTKAKSEDLSRERASRSEGGDPTGTQARRMIAAKLARQYAAKGKPSRFGTQLAPVADSFRPGWCQLAPHKSEEDKVPDMRENSASKKAEEDFGRKKKPNNYQREGSSTGGQTCMGAGRVRKASAKKTGKFRIGTKLGSQYEAEDLPRLVQRMCIVGVGDQVRTSEERAQKAEKAEKSADVGMRHTSEERTLLAQMSAGKELEKNSRWQELSVAGTGWVQDWNKDVDELWKAMREENMLAGSLTC